MASIGQPEDPIDEIQPIIDAVRKQETKQSGWFSKLVILGVSIAFFIFLGALQWELNLVLILVPILLVHELGHYVAMKAFGYKNIHMFFIPLLGAAVSGRNYRVSGWKKAIVSLAGPLPSIVLGLALAAAGWWFNVDWCMKAALITLILNVLNLAPFLPLDGGQVAHVTLFSRSNRLDLLFRVATIGLLLVVAALLGAKILFGLGIAMVITLPTVWRTMQITDALRNQGLPIPTDDTMPAEAIRAVVDEIGRSNLPAHGTPTLAKLTLSVYENVIIRPPSWPATAGIGALYLGGLMSGAAGLVAIMLAPHVEDWFDIMPEFQSHYESVDLIDVHFHLGSVKPDSFKVDGENAKTDLLAWRFTDSQSASDAYSKLADDGGDSVSRMGNFVFTSKPGQTGNLTLFNGDFEDQMKTVERHAINDHRLDVLAGSTWRRSFSHTLPALIVVVKPEQADAIIRATESLPMNINDFAPIAPWTPQSTLTEQQKRLRRKLRVLQGRTEVTPWETVKPRPKEEDATASGSFRQSMRDAARRIELTQANRLQWISDQAETTVGDEKQLYTAYYQYTTSFKEWRQDERDVDEKGQAPQLQNHLGPLLPQLGYLHEKHPLLATSVNLDAFLLDPEIESESFADSFPLPYQDRSIVFLNLYPTRDAAAAYASVHAWLKDQGAQTVVWTYNTIKQAE